MDKDISWLIQRPIAHRGLHDLNHERWENTLSAFEAACAAGFAIECDVHLSADGVPIVFHDHALQRLTGAEGQLCDKPASELVQLRVGGTADHVPTFAEMLALVAGRVPIVVELKSPPGDDRGLVARVAAALETYDGKAAIMSFDHRLVRRFADEAPHVARRSDRGRTRLTRSRAALFHAGARHLVRVVLGSGSSEPLHRSRKEKSGPTDNHLDGA